MGCLAHRLRLILIVVREGAPFGGMMIRSFLFSLGLVWSFSSSAAERPNIIYVLADDLGYGDLSCYGQETLNTPAIDRMAADGMRFTRHYSGSTVCAPSRAVLMTGRHTGRVSVRGNQVAALSETTVATVLKENGYRTGCVGKWGIGHPPPLDDPNRHGFDYFYGYVNMFHAHNFYPSFLVENGKKVPLGNVQMEAFRAPPEGRDGVGVAEVAVDYAPAFIADKAVEFIRESAEGPFFLYYALNIPHANNEGGRYDRGMEIDHLGEFADKPWPLAEKGFAAMMKRIDDDVARIFETLDDLGVAENTLVMFSSDNGPHQEGGHQVDFFDSNGLRRGMKRDLYEGGVRVPFIAHWPGKIAPGSVVDNVTAFQDLMPTVRDLLGLSPMKTDGESMLPILRGARSKPKQRTLYWEFGERGGKQSVLQGDWKLIRFGLENPVYELYNVVEDPSEELDRFSEFPERASALKKILETVPDDRSAFKDV